MTDLDLDALLANAKPCELQDIIPDERFAWRRWGNEPVEIPEEIFVLLRGGRFDKFNMIYPTEAAAMDALRAAVQRYKESRT